MAFRNTTFIHFLLLALALNAAADTDKASDTQRRATESSVEIADDDLIQGLLTPFTHPFFQRRVNTVPSDALFQPSTFDFGDPLAALLPDYKGFDEANTDREPLTAPVTQSSSELADSIIPDFSGLLGIDQFSNLGGISGLFDLFGKRRTRKPWWQGPNVCMDREETDRDDTTEVSSEPTQDSTDGAFFSGLSYTMETCKSTESEYECVHTVHSNGSTKSFIVRYHCCLGYNRKSENGFCEKFELETMMNTIKKLNASDFILKNGYESHVSTENLTFFLPTDEAFKTLAEGILESNNIDLEVEPMRKRRGIDGMSPSQLVESHTVTGFHDLAPDTILNSNYQNSSLLINRYVGTHGQPQYLVNCAKVVSPNNYATSGVVNTIDRVLMPVTKNIMETINKRPEFSTFKQLLEKTGVDKDLSEDETWTVFVPTNDAFAKLDEKTFRMVTKGDATSKSIVQSHFLGPVLCSSIVESGVIGVTNANGDITSLSSPKKIISNEIDTDMSQPAVFYIGNIKVSKADIVATHGVIHAIDEVIIPQSALPLVKVLDLENLTGFRDVIIQSKMEDEIEAMSNVTFFVPTNEAVQNYFKNQDAGEVSSLLEGENEVSTKPPIIVDEKKGREFVLHHIIEGALPSSKIRNNMIKKTLLDQPDTLRMNLYSTVLQLFANTHIRATANCARIVNFGIPQRDNLVHLVGQAIPKQTGSILDIINNDPQLETLKKVLVGTQLEKDLESMKDITFLAPTNDVFSKLSMDDFDILSNNKKFADSLLRQHAIQGVMCCDGLQYLPFPLTLSVRNINGQNLAVHNNRIGPAVITGCDHVADNGVLHFTNSIMISNRRRIMSSENPNVNIFLYGI